MKLEHSPSTSRQAANERFATIDFAPTIATEIAQSSSTQVFILEFRFDCEAFPTSDAFTTYTVRDPPRQRLVDIFRRISIHIWRDRGLTWYRAHVHCPRRLRRSRLACERRARFTCGKRIQKTKPRKVLARPDQDGCHFEINRELARNDIVTTSMQDT